MSSAVTALSTAWRSAATWRANGLPGPPGFRGTKRPRLSRTSPFGDGGVPPVGTSPGGAAGAAAGDAAGPLDGVSTVWALMASVNMAISFTRCDQEQRAGPDDCGPRRLSSMHRNKPAMRTEDRLRHKNRGNSLLAGCLA